MSAMLPKTEVGYPAGATGTNTMTETAAIDRPPAFALSPSSL